MRIGNYCESALGMFGVAALLLGLLAAPVRAQETVDEEPMVKTVEATKNNCTHGKKDGDKPPSDENCTCTGDCEYGHLRYDGCDAGTVEVLDDGETVLKCRCVCNPLVVN